MNSAFSGEVVVEVGGVKRTLRYDWAALAKLRTALGKDFDGKVSQALLEGDVEVLAVALACGLSPALTPEEVMKASPSIVAVAGPIELALRYAYFGQGGPSGQKAAENPPKSPSVMLWSWLSRRLFGLESSRASSGV